MRLVRTRFDLSLHSWAAVLVTYAIVQNHPDQAAELRATAPIA